MQFIYNLLKQAHVKWSDKLLSMCITTKPKFIHIIIYYWNKVTVHHLKLCVVVVKLASTPMMDTHDTEFVNWLLTPHLFKDVSRSLVSKHTDFEIILLTVKQWFNRTPQIIVLSFFIKK